MADTTTFHVIRRREFSATQLAGTWSDPHGICQIRPEKVRTFLENPVAQDETEPMSLLAVKAGQVVGRMDLMPGLLGVRGEKSRIYWCSNLFVPATERNSLAGALLVLKAQALHHTVGVVGVSQEALPIYQKLKWDEATMPRFILLRRSRAVVERYVPTPPLQFAARLAADAALLAHRAAGAVVAIRAAGLRITQVDRADEELDKLLAPNYEGIETFRSAAQINWSLGNSFDADPRNRKGLFYVRDRTGRLIAYFMAKIRFYETATHRGFKNLYLASIQDWRIFDLQVISLQRLVPLALHEISAWNPDAVELCVPPSSSRLNLRRWGFLRVGSLAMLFKRSVQSPTRQPGFPEPTAWLARPSDGDNLFS